MITDKIPKKSDFKDEYVRSESMRMIALPPPVQLREYSRELEAALKREDRRTIAAACNAIAVDVSDSFGVKPPPIKILGVRPLKASGHRVEELFGDYEFESTRIRLWMRTAVLEKPTSFGTLLSTLCHELCHHLDVVNLELPNTFHTRGFYERAGLLYHHVRGTPMRPLHWDSLRDGTFRINWPATMRGARIQA